MRVIIILELVTRKRSRFRVRTIFFFYFKSNELNASYAVVHVRVAKLVNEKKKMKKILINSKTGNKMLAVR